MNVTTFWPLVIWLAWPCDLHHGTSGIVRRNNEGPFHVIRCEKDVGVVPPEGVVFVTPETVCWCSQEGWCGCVSNEDPEPRS